MKDLVTTAHPEDVIDEESTEKDTASAEAVQLEELDPVH